MSRPYISGQLLTADDLNIGIRAEGDGSDGDVIISVDTDLTRNMYYNNLTINSGKILNTKGYRIFVKGTLTNEGIIQNSGTNGGNGNTDGCQAPGDNGGAGGVGGYFNGGTDGSYGGPGQCHFSGGTAPEAGTNKVNTICGDGVNGGNASLKGTGTIYEQVSTLFELKTGSSEAGKFWVCGGSCGGAGGGGEYGGQGGGAGGSGGIIGIYAKYLINNGIIRALGGNGGNGHNAADLNSDGGSGGGGGNGGIIILVYQNKTGSGSVSVASGTGGAGGSGTRGSGVAGSNGNVGKILDFPN